MMLPRCSQSSRRPHSGDCRPYLRRCPPTRSSVLSRRSAPRCRHGVEAWPSHSALRDLVCDLPKWLLWSSTIWAGMPARSVFAAANHGASTRYPCPFRWGSLSRTTSGTSARLADPGECLYAVLLPWKSRSCQVWCVARLSGRIRVAGCLIRAYTSSATASPPECLMEAARSRTSPICFGIGTSTRRRFMPRSTCGVSPPWRCPGRGVTNETHRRRRARS